MQGSQSRARPNFAARRVAILAAALNDLQANRFHTVAEHCGRLLRRDPNDIEALLLCGLAAGARGHAEHAARLLHRAARGRGSAEHPFRDLIGILCRIGRPEWIAVQFDALRRCDPHNVAPAQVFAEYLYDNGRPAEAIPLLRDTLVAQPDSMPARNLLAMALAACGDTEAAIARLREATRQDPGRAGIWANLGLLLKDDGAFDEALAAYDTALALTPDDAQIRVNRVVALLRAGRWSEAWPDYEWRLTLAGHAMRRPHLLPAVSGLDLRGRTVLAVHEDGFGDTLHFARYLPLLVARGARVVVSVPPSLKRIMRGVPGVAEVHDPERWPPHDFYCPFFSLPRAFETTPDRVPAPIPYLTADPELAAAWHARLPPGRPRVGLVWAGLARPMVPGFSILDGRRSLSLAALAPLAAVPGVVFVSLQYGEEARQLEAPPAGMVLFDPMPRVRDFADTAAIVANLDLVISVDTAVVHLAGALGKPVLLLDRYDHCWRWLSGRTDSPWYPGLRIARQRRHGDWGPVLREATAVLAELAVGSGAAGHSVGVDLLKIPETVERDA